MEARFCGQRDRAERHDLIAAQMKEPAQILVEFIDELRTLGGINVSVA